MTIPEYIFIPCYQSTGTVVVSEQSTVMQDVSCLSHSQSSHLQAAQEQSSDSVRCDLSCCRWEEQSSCQRRRSTDPPSRPIRGANKNSNCQTSRKGKDARPCRPSRTPSFCVSKAQQAATASSMTSAAILAKHSSNHSSSTACTSNSVPRARAA
ncbi:expressed unknown protein [Seminavis robusta]|uniref:Uncharacterized protein n=1 Tax=Seminavis robusta TaxID=568900 RepID=A0A9N8D9T1_9STRA|nr:expressed unknown protein [Seminavis robusta]|eukprot:Sro10_g007961.1  (154) ;mRNA; r:63787-64248